MLRQRNSDEDSILTGVVKGLASAGGALIGLGLTASGMPEAAGIIKDVAMVLAFPAGVTCFTVSALAASGMVGLNILSNMIVAGKPSLDQSSAKVVSELEAQVVKARDKANVNMLGLVSSAVSAGCTIGALFFPPLILAPVVKNVLHVSNEGFSLISSVTDYLKTNTTSAKLGVTAGALGLAGTIVSIASLLTPIGPAVLTSIGAASVAAWASGEVVKKQEETKHLSVEPAIKIKETQDIFSRGKAALRRLGQINALKKTAVMQNGANLIPPAVVAFTEFKDENHLGIRGENVADNIINSKNVSGKQHKMSGG